MSGTIRWTWQRSETEHRLHEEYDDGRPPLLILRAKTTHAGKLAPPLRSNEELIASLPDVVRERATYKSRCDALEKALRDAENTLHAIRNSDVRPGHPEYLSKARIAAIAGKSADIARAALARDEVKP